jgi:hypothetical protein
LSRSATALDPDEAAEIIADNDKLEAISRNLGEALFFTLKALAWPGVPEVLSWNLSAFGSRVEAARLAQQLRRPRRLSGIHVARLYRAALRQIATEHEFAKSLEPGTPEAIEPQPLPETCRLKMRQLLEMSEIPTRLGLWGVADLGVIEMD